MSIIQSGKRYKITNEGNGSVLDLDAADDKSILGWWEFHGGQNQQVSIKFPSIPIGGSTYIYDAFQWILERHSDDQWTIRTVHLQKYLGFESTPNNGTRLVGLDRPQLWDIEILPHSKDRDYIRIKYGFYRVPPLRLAIDFWTL